MVSLYFPVEEQELAIGLLAELQENLDEVQTALERRYARERAEIARLGTQFLHETQKDG
jgi:hypothetical protein